MATSKALSRSLAERSKLTACAGALLFARANQQPKEPEKCQMLSSSEMGRVD